MLPTESLQQWCAAVSDIYLYEDVPVLKNKLDIRDEKTLDLIEAEQSRANMMILYERGFSDFTPTGLRKIHQFLFGDIYDWAGQYRIINIEKRERLLGGRSVWYSNDEAIPDSIHRYFRETVGAVLQRRICAYSCKAVSACMAGTPIP